jgi:CO/xanthine dehydrogenase Mo-binding subunit
LTNEPVDEGDLILAVAATSELIAAEAIERIVVDFEPLPFVVDPIDSLRPGNPNARLEGNVWAGSEVKTIKWTASNDGGAGRRDVRRRVREVATASCSGS